MYTFCIFKYILKQTPTNQPKTQHTTNAPLTFRLLSPSERPLAADLAAAAPAPALLTGAGARSHTLPEHTPARQAVNRQKENRK